MDHKHGTKSYRVCFGLVRSLQDVPVFKSGTSSFLLVAISYGVELAAGLVNPVSGGVSFL